MKEVSSLSGGANAAATVTLVGVEDYRHEIFGIHWSYSGDPTGGSITISGLIGDPIVMDITVGGPGMFPEPPAWGELGTNVVFTLAAGGGSLVGRLSIIHKKVE